MYIAVPITGVLAAIITVLIITCIGCIVCNVARKKDGKIEVTSQETLDTDDNLPFQHQQTIMLQKYEQQNEHKM